MKPPQPVGPPARINRTIKVRTSYQPRRKKPEFWLPTNTDGSGIVDRLDYSKNGNSLRQEAIYAKLQRKFEKERISGKSVGKVQFDTAVRQSIVNYTDGKRDAYRTLSRPLSARTTPVPEALRKSIESLTTPKERQRMYDGLEKNLATIEAEYNLKPKYPHYPPEWISLNKERRKRVKSYIKDKKEGKLVVIQRLKENPRFWNPQF